MPADRQDLRRALYQLAATQAGYFTAAQARKVGYSYQAQRYHAHRGNWTQIDRGLYRLFEWPTDVHDDLVRWTLWSASKAVISHETALDVHGIGEFNPARVHLTVPPSFTKKTTGVAIHRNELESVDVQEWTGFRVTTPIRSLIDVAAAGTDNDHLERAIEEACDRGLLTPSRLRERAETINAKAALYIERSLGRLRL